MSHLLRNERAGIAGRHVAHAHLLDVAPAGRLPREVVSRVLPLRSTHAAKCLERARASQPGLGAASPPSQRGGPACGSRGGVGDATQR
jgi:hypothetical protein